ncbi:MAG: S-layer homology domain-containing protein [Oscillospiraceae bacterium]|nr:S-layer homology domain-containing protein [Oscillospiraceae bacterium]
MKTLKKTLCLVLALIMVVGTLAVAASATVAKTVDNFANYKDAAAAKASVYAKAIDVNLGLGIIKGVSKTEIKIDGTLTRAQAAKIVCYLLVGAESAEEDLMPGTSFSDVPESHWANKYIAFASSDEVGILNGVGGGKFNPNGTLKGIDFLKILLNALGIGISYDEIYVPQPDGSIKKTQVAKNEFTGANYATKVKLAAKDANIGTSYKMNYTQPITRAEAMALVFDVIWEYGGNVAYEIKEAPSMITDAYGREIVQYTDMKNNPITSVYPKTPFYTYNVLQSGKKLSEIVADYNKENKLEGDKAIVLAMSDETYGAGWVVELFAEDNKYIYDTVVYSYSIDKITNVDKDGKVKSAMGLYNDKVIKDAKKDDLILLPFSWNLMTPILDEAKKVTAPDLKAKISSYDKSTIGTYVTVSGAKYYADDYFNDAIGLKKTFAAFCGDRDFTNEFGLYLSPAGTVLAVDKLTNETPVTNLYAFAVAYQTKAAGTSTTDLFGNTTGGAEAGAAVQIVTPAGENKVVFLALDKDGKVTNKVFFTKTGEESNALDGDKPKDSVGNKPKAITPVLVEYHESNGKVVITDVFALTDATGYTKASPTLGGKTLTSDTNLFIVTVKDGKYTAQKLVGWKNFPAFDTGAKYYADADDKNVAKNVYVYGAAKSETEVKTYSVIAYILSKGDVTAKGVEIKALVDGKETTYYATEAVAGAIAEKTFYKDLAVDDEGHLKAPTAVAGPEFVVTGVDAGYFQTATQLYQYPANVKVVDLTGKGLTAVAKGQTIVVFSTKVGDEAIKTDGKNDTWVIFIKAVAE